MEKNNLIYMLDNKKKKTNRIFNSLFRKNLKEKISKLSSKKDYLYIYTLISKELDSKFSVNKNGVYFNINLLSDDCINELSKYISDKFDSETISEVSKIKYETYYKENCEDLNFSYACTSNKFSNQEKTILKKLHQK
jgi:hypothetical protein